VAGLSKWYSGLTETGSTSGKLLEAGGSEVAVVGGWEAAAVVVVAAGWEVAAVVVVATGGEVAAAGLWVVLVWGWAAWLAAGVVAWGAVVWAGA